MRVEQLQYVAAVARHGSFRRAAEELHISQPALSEAITKLEDELGTRIIDRRRSGATISDGGRELLPHVLTIIDGVQRLRNAADQQHRFARSVRLGTVTVATAHFLMPTIQAFHTTHLDTVVEVVNAQQLEIYAALRGGGVDLGLVNYILGDDVPPEFESVELLRGYPVACMRSDNPLASRPRVSAADLRGEPLIAMRSGYLMHRVLHRLLGGEASYAYSGDGAEMGMLMVAAGLGIAILPDYTVAGDPLERRGELIYRPIDGDEIIVYLAIHRLRTHSTTAAVRELYEQFIDRARTERGSE
jgi:DNA-binding transcriptional LysR family regulator